jgi:hypothetical protein
VELRSGPTPTGPRASGAVVFAAAEA